MTLNESDATRLELTRNFLELSRNVETCTDLRSSDCIQILVQILHANDEGLATARKYASQALHNIVHSNPEEKERQREVKMLRLLDQILDYCNFLRTQLQSGGEAIADDEDRHPLAAMKLLMKASFDEEHRATMCELGALKAIPNLVHLDHAVHGPAAGREQCNALRSYGLMALTNLTFGDENVHNKSYLCGQRQFMEVVIAQLNTAPDDLLQVLAGVLRNLSWRADKHMKTIFNELGTVTALARAAMQNKSENTLKAVLSALWNLSAHCSTNKAEFCAVDGALAFLVSMLSYEGPSKTLKIIENAGGILRNVSSHIAVCESYREILRRHNGLSILLQQLKSESLTVVSNSCGTLWNLSARCPEDQQFLIDHNAIPLLRALIASKNSMIAEGSASALKNLVNFRAALELLPNGDSLPLENDAGHAGTLPRRYSSLRLSSNPTGSLKKVRPATVGKSEFLTRKCGGSRESIYSAKSDSTKYSSKSEGVAKNPFEIVTPTEEQPIDYSMKYMEHKPDTKAFEIDLDQPTDFSARYKERRSITTASTAQPKIKTEANEITSDALPLVKSDSASALLPVSVTKREAGEQPINYCEEGTPGSFSRFDSLNSLTEKTDKSTDPMALKTPTKPAQPPPGALTLHSNTPQNIDSALETPLMFSRRSSMDSLVGGDDETIACEDNGSVISEYSRMQSGVISPSELPDSPTQSMPQSPRRDRKMPSLPNGQHQNETTPTTMTPRKAPGNVFEDKLNRFHIEHTPAVFSCATSLSNLSILDDSNANGNREAHGNDINGNGDAPRSYCTEDTPALLSKAPSNSNLSILSIPNDLNGNEEQLPPPRVPVMAAASTEDAIDKMRCGGSSLPSYLPVSDEMSKYYVEDSPCTFSVISGLSHLTVGSARAGPVSQLPMHRSEEAPKLPPRRNASSQVEVEPRLPPKRSDSLSSLSMDSDDDCNLLSQAIAAGSCRPQPSGASASTSSSHANTSTSTLSKANGQRRQTMDDGSKLNYSSDDSLDDDDAQSKSLFEQCILSGMHKSSDALESEGEPASLGQAQEGSARDRFVSNQVRQIESMLAGGRPTPPTASIRQQEHRV
ncbi:adenomatous polyposis coli protein [Drosophila subobscura]|uniref:adenomatous polyposis coli protein n=1 Tax=Drosophila subobscura TaxID=7241 RepID=UPI00155B1B5B|nr:adenomatous polyposis coli protein [Drosophila subobscura]